SSSATRPASGSPATTRTSGASRAWPRRTWTAGRSRTARVPTSSRSTSGESRDDSGKVTMKRFHLAIMGGLGAALLSCGGGGSGGPSAPAPAPTPTPIAAATPTPPAPTPEPTPPCPTDPCELPVERDTKPVRITLRLFVVEDPAGGVYQYRENDGGLPIIPVPYRFRLDIIA